MNKQYPYVGYQSDKDTLDSFKLWERILSPLPTQEENTNMTQHELENGTIHATVDKVYSQDENVLHSFLDVDAQHVMTTQGVIDRTTGEVISSLVPFEEEENEIMLPPSSTPRYLKALAALQDMTVEDKAALLSVYDTPVKLKSFKEYLNQEVELFGAIVWTHPVSTSKTEKNDDGTPKTLPSYEQIRMLAYENGEPVIIAASYGALAVHIEGLLSLQNWYLWDKPVTYKFSQDLKTNAFKMSNVARVSAILSKMKKDSTKK